MKLIPKTITIVEDEPDIDEMFAEVMRVNGCEIVKADNGGPEIALITKEVPAADVLDINMPDMSGIDVLSCIRSLPEIGNTLVVESATNLFLDKLKDLDAGASVYLTKAVVYLESIEALESVMQAADQERIGI